MIGCLIGFFRLAKKTDMPGSDGAASYRLRWLLGFTDQKERQMPAVDVPSINPVDPVLQTGLLSP